ncbi:Translation initiation factor SUI1 [Spraguea lophii 42_110]|uniref:Translation initiation factor SUI1 n=1 Tax=Spraguea lophii (strain 42_110) TaxID=1358809 RepID=S7XIM6_SPRLO|nr:Translation initiation factor SUI1 [Spraguea lophii 42_110]
MAEEIVTDEKTLHVRIQQLNRRKKVTLIEGIPDDQKEKILKFLKKKKSCGGSISKENGGVQLQGDYSYEIEEDLSGLFSEYKIVMHGKR